jgi:thioredoxin 2
MIVNCPSCGKRNRIPAEHLADRGRCGSCKGELPPASRPIEVDAAQFTEITKNARVPVLVDFWAAWCAPCRLAAPEVERTAAEMAGRALVLKVDTEAHPQIAQQYGVQGIPNFVVLKSGLILSQRAGLAPSAQMKSWLEAAGA